MKTTDREREAQIIRSWLQDVMRATGLKATPLAKRAEIAPSTPLRALKKENPTALERSSIRQIVTKIGISGPPLDGDQPSVPALVQPGPELVRLTDQPASWAGIMLTPNQYVARIATRALDLLGIQPGDQILFDMAESAEAADVVAAQIYSPTLGAETVLRMVDQPYLVTRSASAEHNAKPLLVDGEWVRIAAVAKNLLRAF